MMIGAMYITPNYLCFTGELINDRLSVILSLADIDKIDEGVAAFMERYRDVPTITPSNSDSPFTDIEVSYSTSRPNALVITDNAGMCHRLYSFTDPIKTSQTLYSVWMRNPMRVARNRIQSGAASKETTQSQSQSQSQSQMPIGPPLPPKPIYYQTK